MPGSGSQDGDKSQRGAEKDPAPDMKDGRLAPPPDHGPQIVSTVLLSGQAGLLPSTPGH